MSKRTGVAGIQPVRPTVAEFLKHLVSAEALTAEGANPDGSDRSYAHFILGTAALSGSGYFGDMIPIR